MYVFMYVYTFLLCMSPGRHWDPRATTYIHRVLVSGGINRFPWHHIHLPLSFRTRPCLATRNSHVNAARRSANLTYTYIIHTHIHADTVFVFILRSLWLHVCMFELSRNTYIHTCIRTYIHTHTYMHTFLPSPIPEVVVAVLSYLEHKPRWCSAMPNHFTSIDAYRSCYQHVYVYKDRYVYVCMYVYSQEVLVGPLFRVWDLY